jgi:hypothetical protein
VTKLCGVGGIVALAATIVLGTVPAVAQTAPSPSPTLGGSSPSGSPVTHFWEGNYTVSAGTNQTDGAVDYTAQDGVTINSTGVHQGGGRQCLGETPTQAGVTYGSLVRVTGVTQTSVFPVPEFNGNPLQLSGTVPASGGTEYIVVCGGVPVGFGFWVPGPSTTAVAATPQQIANQVSGEIPMPSVTVGINPPIGLSGLQAWFWISGYSGTPIVETPPALGQTLVVQATPTDYVWNFGDGSAPLTTTSLGQPYPRQSDITHTYRAMNADYQVQVTFNFNVRYQVNGGAWVNLQPIQRSATANYQVGQVRTIIVSRG